LIDAGMCPRLIEEKAMTPLRQRMMDALVLHGKAARTQEACRFGGCAIGAVLPAQSGHFERGTDRGAYLVHLLAASASSRAPASTRPAARSISCLARCWGEPSCPTACRCHAARSGCPRSGSRAEIARLLACACSLKARTVLTCAYALGLRVSELCALRLEHLDTAAAPHVRARRAGQGGQGSLRAAAS
jgi:hypothetical protein